MDPLELVIKLRYEQELREPLEGVVITTGGAAAMGDGARLGYVLVSEKDLTPLMPRIRACADKIAGHRVRLVYVRANT